MTTDLIEINDFVVLIGATETREIERVPCKLDDEVIGISFFGSGEIQMNVSYGDSVKSIEGQKGTAFSFFGNQGAEINYSILPSGPFREVSIFSTLKNIQKLPLHEKELYLRHLENLFSSQEDFALGPKVLMNHEMQMAISKIFNTQFRETTRLVFLKSQVIELLSHYFHQISTQQKTELRQDDRDRIQHAREIILNNIDKPPSLKELSKLIGMNHNKLNKNFKQIFGMPVFKYLQNQRLQKAHQLLKREEMAVQEAAWFVGYESLSSFSNAFYKKFGFRPSEINK